MPKKNAAQESTQALSRQAATWLVLLKDQRGLSFQEGRAFLKWLVRSRRHVYEFLLICREDVRLTRVLRDQSQAANAIHARPWQVARPAKADGRYDRLRWNAAAMAVLVLALFFSLKDDRDNATNGFVESSAGSVVAPDEAVAITTKKAETQRLADGTRVSVDAGSALRVEFSPTRRDVHLLEGKALFEVANDTQRPFVVNTLWANIVADEESKFAVTIDTSVEVAVYDGMVEVLGRGGRAGAQRITVKRGQTYRVQFRDIVADGRGGSKVVIKGFVSRAS